MELAENVRTKHARVKDRALDRLRAELAMSVAAYALGERADKVSASTRGSAGAAFARQVAMYLAHVAHEMSLARVGAAFDRDRSTVAHACHRIEDRREDASFDAWISSLEAMLHAAPQPPEPSPDIKALML